MGSHSLSAPTLIYMPHCAKPLYEALLSANYSPALSTHILLGNVLYDYVPDLARPTKDDFAKTKKKRKDREPASIPQDSVIRRLGESHVGAC